MGGDGVAGQGLHMDEAAAAGGGSWWRGRAGGGGGPRGVGLWCVIIVDVVLWQVICNVTHEKK